MMMMKKTAEDSLKKTFPKFKLLNSGCGLSAGAAYLWVFTVIHLLSSTQLLHNDNAMFDLGLTN